VKVGKITEFAFGQLKSERSSRELLVANAEGYLYTIDGRCSHLGLHLSKGGFRKTDVDCKTFAVMIEGSEV
jgi:nitrite reductase/ring-hydroxylating ferredoxin subunit